MPRFETGNVWSVMNDTHSIILIPANAQVTNDGLLVMGKGFALQATERLPLSPKIFGDELVRTNAYNTMYGVLLVTIFDIQNKYKEYHKLGIFQTKLYPQHNSLIPLIKNSTAVLIEYANEMPHTTFHLPYPGIGMGKLTKEEVYPVIKQLPENVTIWEQ